MATGSTNRYVTGLGDGTVQLTGPLSIVDENGTTTWSVASTGTTAVPLQKRLFSSKAKVGGTSGAVVNAADNKNSLFRVPASQTASTIVIPLDTLKVGDIITGWHLVGQIESAGGICTVDSSLRKQTAAAADLTDAAVAGAGMTQLSVTADTIMSSANTTGVVTADTVGVDETFYLLVTVTTAASTDVDCQAVAIVMTEA